QIDRLPRLDLLGIAAPLENNTAIRRVVQALLDAIDNTWPSSKPTRTKNEALPCLAFIRGDLLDQRAEAIVNAVGRDPMNFGEIGEALTRRVGSEQMDELLAQGKLTTGETIVTKLRGGLDSRYVIHVCSESETGGHSSTSIVQAVNGA